MKVGKRYKSWHPDRVKAIDYARQTFRDVFKKNLRLYDKTKQRGRLVDYGAVKNEFLRDKVLYDTELAFVDYLQVFSTGVINDNQYHRSEMGAALLLDLVKTEGVSVVALAQQNEEGVKNGSGASPQVAGGGALPKAVASFVHSAGSSDHRSPQLHLSEGPVLVRCYTHGVHVSRHQRR